LLPFNRSEAKEWAKSTWYGAANVVIPTFSNDYKKLNPKAIAHDVKLSAEHGFWGSLLVSEGSTTLEEMKEFIDISVDARPKDFRLILHGSFNTIEETIEVSQYAEQQGVEALLLSYPQNFYPKSEQEIYEYTKAVADKTNMALIIFAVESWNFGRIHNSKFPVSLIKQIAEIDTAVAVKYEAGHPGMAGMAECQRAVGDKVIVCDPMENNSPLWVDTYGMQWMGTSNYEMFGDLVPKYFNLFREGKFEEGMELFWKLVPARTAKTNFHKTFAGAKLIHRLGWKYLAWLNGYNGGPLRMPQMRLDDAQMNLLKTGLQKSGIKVTEEPNENFFVGRNPM
jgi:4-hydroxy-tetrahydrodipicolinate synthase